MKTHIATSGHISAHKAQPVHVLLLEKTATVTPTLLGFSLITTNLFGQAIVQRPHPLQRASFIVMYGILIDPLIISMSINRMHCARQLQGSTLQHIKKRHGVKLRAVINKLANYKYCLNLS